MSDDPHPREQTRDFLEFHAELTALPMGIQSLYAASAGLHRLNLALRAIGEAMSSDKVEADTIRIEKPALPPAA